MAKPKDVERLKLLEEVLQTHDFDATVTISTANLK